MRVSPVELRQLKRNRITLIYDQQNKHLPSSNLLLTRTFFSHPVGFEKIRLISIQPYLNTTHTQASSHLCKQIVIIKENEKGESENQKKLDWKIPASRKRILLTLITGRHFLPKCPGTLPKAIVRALLGSVCVASNAILPMSPFFKEKKRGK
ncbi:uncharacterized protein VTP21DRAFT_11586 [Calcarisporiella thermophila]|uniref:uncharacterized protein n=1 Tax=Calcarisporiella thermophila TaxID=911321 RepID=UPI0037433593